MKTEAALRRFEAYLQSRGLRITQPRREILELAWSTHSHFTADQLFLWARERDSSASRATVYRTLGLLVEGGFIAALDGGRGQMLYEHILGHHHHDHMICLDCEKIIEFRSEAIESLQEEAAQQKRFHMVSHTLTLEGYCSNCWRKRETSTEPAESAEEN